MGNTGVSALFCEDYRVEAGDKPFLIGIYAPVIYNSIEDQDDEETEFFLAIFTSTTSDQDVIEIDVSMTVLHPDQEPKKRLVNHSFPREAFAGRPGIDWGFSLPLPIRETMKFGSRLDCEIHANDASTRVMLTMLEHESADEDQRPSYSIPT